MNKRLLMIAGLLSVSVSSLFAATSYFRTPLSFLQKPRTTVHYPLPPIDECDDWIVDAFGLYYQRNACDAFGRDPDCVSDDCSNPCDSNDKTTTHTVPLSQLWFGKSSFAVEDGFLEGTIEVPTGNPFVKFARLNPQFDYNERGAALGITLNRYNLGCDNSWFVSGRVALPIKVIEVNQRRACDCEEIVEDFANAVVTVQQQFNGQADDGPPSTSNGNDSRTVKAYRLDLLSTLKQDNGDPMVEYGTGSTNTKVAGQDITVNVNQVLQGSAGTYAPMYVYKQSSGKVPFAPGDLNRNTSYVAAPGQDLMIGEPPKGILTADGGSVSNPAAALNDGEWASFNGVPNAIGSQPNYAGGLGASDAAQRQLFLVPVSSSSSVTFEPIGLTVQNTIDRVLEDLELLNTGAVSYLASKGVDFGRSDCSTGAGDTFIDIWGGKMTECWFADGLIGFRLPTGTNYDNPHRIYQQTTGNNGHFATKLGVEGGYKPCDWLGMKLEFFWRHNFNRVEKRAAAFKGAEIRNIGPCIDARVNWDDFQLYTDFTFFSQRCPDLGWDFGYEFYAKTKDDVCFCATEAEDWSGQLQQLDKRVLERDTNTQAHKVRAEIFNQWGCFQLFFGGSYIIAGKNVMKETQWHLGMKTYF